MTQDWSKVGEQRGRDGALPWPAEVRGKTWVLALGSEREHGNGVCNERIIRVKGRGIIQTERRVGNSKGGRAPTRAAGIEAKQRFGLGEEGTNFLRERTSSVCSWYVLK